VKKGRIFWIWSLLVSVALGVLLHAWQRSGNLSAQRNGQFAMALFSGNPAQNKGDFSERDFSRQHRFVEVKASTLEALVNGTKRVRLQLFDGLEYTAVLKGQEMGPVAMIATGKLEEVAGSEVIFSTASGKDGSRKVSGKFTMPDGREFGLTPTKDGHCLFEMDHERFDIGCGPSGANGKIETYVANGERIQLLQQQVNRRWLRSSRPTSSSSSSSSSSGSSSSSSGGSSSSSSSSGGSSSSSSSGGGSSSSGGAATIDILFMYTSKAASARGGDSGIKSHIGLAVAEANSAFQNSKISVTLKLVATGKMIYDSNGNLSAAMSKLKKDSTTKALRNSKNADLISLMITGSSGGYTGLGSVMPTSKGNVGACYSVVHEKSPGTFAHEVGHNLGSLHCWDQDGKGVFKYSHGHRWKGTDGKRYRSIMSYSKGGDKRTAYFSNPSVTYKGVATGDPTKADNAKTFKVTAPVVSKYR